MSGIQLIPIDATSKNARTDRNTLTISANHPDVLLGSQDSAGIESSDVVKLYKKGSKFFVYCLQNSSSHATLLNGFQIQKGGRRGLKLGDILAFRSSEDPDDGEGDFCYQVEPLTGDPTNMPSAAAGGTTALLEAEESGEDISVTAPAGVASAAVASLPKEVGEEAICAICMEIMLEPRTVAPCGHSFCRLCLTRQSECAECRGPITSHVVCRSLQNLIEQLVKLHTNGTTVFENEDFETYINRSEGIVTGPSGASATNALSARKRQFSRMMSPRATRLRAPADGEVIVCLDD
jgi:RING-type zinc-finger